MSDEQKPRKRRRRVPKSEDDLMQMALRYLERFPTSEARLRRHLDKKVSAAVEDEAASAEEAGGWVDGVVARLVRVRLLDDTAYAASRARALMRRGKSQRAIRMDLKQKGLGAEDVDAALAGLEEEAADPELAAACALARRRRLGPWYGGEDRAERRQKHMASLARAGFSFDVARRVVDAEEPGVLEAEL
ncbi:MAG: regulatory protein RecX [Myxococcota bacterium]